MPTHKSEDFKISAVNYYLDSNKTQEEVCDIFKCSVRSLMRWVERYENDDNIKRHTPSFYRNLHLPKISKLYIYILFLFLPIILNNIFLCCFF